MTQLSDRPEASTDALSIRSEASERVLARQLCKTWSDEDQTELNKWLDASPANRTAYWRMEAAWNQAQRLSALRKQGQVQAAPRKFRISGRIIGAVAAMIVCAVVGAVAVPGLKPPTDKTYITPVGGRLTLALADGSKIDLNTDTVLRLPNGNARNAILERGEAYFQIRHDGDHPFQVSVGGNRIVDLGTKFSVRAGAGRVEVAVLEGSAKVEPADITGMANAAILIPGDVAVVTPTSLVVSKSAEIALTDKLAWRHDMLAFKYATLAEAAREFNRYNDTKIVIDDPRVAKLTIYGNFPTRDVAAFADAAQVSLKLRVRNRNGEIVISR